MAYRCPQSWQGSGKYFPRHECLCIDVGCWMEKKRTAKTTRSGRSDRAYEIMRAEILSGEMSSGAFFLEKELVERLNMSRTPVREALFRLESDRLIRIKPRHGIQVLPISLDDMREIYQLVSILESEAASQLAARGVSSKDLALLEKSTHEMEVALESDDREVWAKADAEFHRHLIGLTGNLRLIDIAQSLHDQTHRARMATLYLRPMPTDSTADHRAVLDSIARGDSESARSRHRAHFTRQLDVMLAYLSRHRLNSL